MCGTWHIPVKPDNEIDVACLNKLPKMFFCNVTGGEPFIRRDLPELIAALRKKASRIVISTNGFFTDRIIELCSKYPDLGIRISIEGFQEANDRIRGIPKGFDKTLRTLEHLRRIGIRDIGLAMTVQDENYHDLAGLYRMASAQGYEFATAAVHNSHYFHKWDNSIAKTEEVTGALLQLIDEFLKSNKIKEWFRAYFNFGLINYVRGGSRLLPCEMGKNGFFLDPWGNVLACNGMHQPKAMGNLRTESWSQIWEGRTAKSVREAVKNCDKNCWMIGSAAPAIIHHPVKPVLWVLKNKFFGLKKNCRYLR